MTDKANIDADLLVYRVGWAAEDVVGPIAIVRLDTMIDGILAACDTDTYECFLTSQDHSNYRFEIDPQYKAGRSLKPKHYLLLREHLIKTHKAAVISGQEADDALGIYQTDSTILVSIDKDLDQIPGRHYNFVKKKHYSVTEEEGLRFFYKQILVGDRTDNVKGLQGIGEVKASRHLDHLTTEAEFYRKVCGLYWSQHPDDYKELILKAGQLLKIRRTEDEALWQLPNVPDGIDQD